jgi:hypothetical protein
MHSLIHLEASLEALQDLLVPAQRMAKDGYSLQTLGNLCVGTKL